MINIHCWEEEEPEDMHLECVVDILLSYYQGLTRDGDVRTKSQEVSKALQAAVAANVALHHHGEGELEDDNGLMKDSVSMDVADSADMSDQVGEMPAAEALSSPSYSRML